VLWSELMSLIRVLRLLWIVLIVDEKLLTVVVKVPIEDVSPLRDVLMSPIPAPRPDSIVVVVDDMVLIDDAKLVTCEVSEVTELVSAVTAADTVSSSVFTEASVGSWLMVNEVRP
jgi:hypothetical protein